MSEVNKSIEKPTYLKKTKYDNSYELMKKFITLFSVTDNMTHGDSHLRPRLVEILTYYVLEGYSRETKHLILDSIPGLKMTNLTQMNSELKTKGYLIPDKYMSHERSLHPELIALREYVLNNKDKSPVFVIRFLKNNGQSSNVR